MPPSDQRNGRTALSLINERRAQMFPVLGPLQLQEAACFASDAPRHCRPAEVLFVPGDRKASAFLVLSGSVEILRHDAPGGVERETLHRAGEIIGELSQLGGRATLVKSRAGPEGCRVVPFDAAHLRALVMGAAERGEAVMRSFILRRAALIDEGAVLVAPQGSPAALRLQDFLARNGLPCALRKPEDADAAELVRHFGVRLADMPALICPNGTLLRNRGGHAGGRCAGTGSRHVAPAGRPHTSAGAGAPCFPVHRRRPAHRVAAGMRVAGGQRRVCANRRELDPWKLANGGAGALAAENHIPGVFAAACGLGR